MATAHAADSSSLMNRPMTSIGAAGFKDDDINGAGDSGHTRGSAGRVSAASGMAFSSSSRNSGGFGNDALSSFIQAGGASLGGTSFQTRAPPLKKRSEKSPEHMALEMERKINKLIEESATFCAKKDFTNALERAKLADKKERLLVKFRDEKNMKEQQNFDLKFCVHFTLAKMYHANGMHTEALDTYNDIVKNKNFPQSARLRVNMGHIYFEQKRYPQATKMYRMALDPIKPSEHRGIRDAIMKNIGIAFIKMGQYHDAIQNLEQIVDPEHNHDVQAAFNLLLCYYAIDDKQSMRRAFDLLLKVKIPGLDQDDDLDDERNTLANDKLRDFLKDKQRQHYQHILKAAKLVAENIEQDDWEKGYDWIIEQLRSFCLKHEKSNLASEMEMAKSLNYLKHKKFHEAIQALQAFEKKDKKLQARAATNLSYLYLLKSDLKNAEKYATLSVDHDKYNAKALVNLGNCQYLRGEFHAAKDTFSKALSAEPDCIQAIYNIGLVTKTPELSQYQESLQTFQRLHSIIPESVEVIYQIADVYRLLGDNDAAADWYNRLITRVPTDPGVLYNLGQIYSLDKDEAQSLNFYLESYRYYPINMDVITWLGLYFVKHEVYEKALQYFQRACQIQPNNIDWKMMVASCYRRIGSLHQAKKCYEEIHLKHLDNLEAIRYLVQISQELGYAQEEKDYREKMKKVEQKQIRQANRRAESGGGSRPTSSAVDDDDTLSRQVKNFNPISLSGQQAVRAGSGSAELTVETQRNGTPTAATSGAPSPGRNVNDKMIEKDDDELLMGIGDDYLDQLYASNLPV